MVYENMAKNTQKKKRKKERKKRKKKKEKKILSETKRINQIIDCKGRGKLTITD